MVTPLILASASSARQRMLQQAGVAFRVDPAAVDEGVIKRRLLASGTGPATVAIALAEAKAMAVSARHPGTMVIGADQVLVCGDRLMDKPVDRDTAAGTLALLRGRSHRLVSAVALVQEVAVVWHYAEVARLTMRAFSDRVLQRYLDAEGSAVTDTVGAYAVEGRGVQLMARIDGDHFTILGLPLLPLLAQLRRLGLAEA